MSHQTTAWRVRPAPSPTSTDEERHPDAVAPPMWLTNGLLIVASAVLLALALASAWLSYHAQVGYVLAHNGRQPAEAKVWALLLDAGTAGVSLLRLYKTLQRRAGAATGFSLIGCIAASVAMNMLHTPSPTLGGYLVAAVPPVMYALFLEHLLANLRSLLGAEAEQRSAWHTFVLWLNFPSPMWRTWRRKLRRAAEEPLQSQEPQTQDADAMSCAGANAAGGGVRTPRSGAARQSAGDGSGSRPHRGRGRGPGPKRVAFESALAQQVSIGDLRLFSGDERERNAAAYEAAASLPAPLSRGTARRYVVQALPRLVSVGATRSGATSPESRS